MESVKLWGVVLPRMTNMLGKVAQTLRIDGTDKPCVKRLEWFPDKQRVVVELESKPEMPTEIILPESQVSAIVPMPKENKREKALDKIAAQTIKEEKDIAVGEKIGKKIAEEKNGTKAKLPDESVSSSKSEQEKPDLPNPKKKRGRSKKKKD
jgi:hypothetical protein